MTSDHYVTIAFLCGAMGLSLSIWLVWYGRRMGDNRMARDEGRCPFHVGDRVVFRPEKPGHYVMMGFAPKRGASYRVTKVEDQSIIVTPVNEAGDPTGPWAWTEFVRAR